ncbi:MULTISPECIES: sigma-54-dependent transcriptional regulator [Roseivirga]|uniref:AAA family ATPase n=1 Tax=Roseivirga spongicola TaxID=333140 RepID=A0A150X3P7_9BACT|nr:MULTISPECIES: sigma-54 dependent transcriptional regulator [Roseivirga]KYG73346.1 AAA family ATPase [Roseivirga spongicola]MBO6659589.1 sigma-54-dependent Fis family transcriptional regulator [Roseivirga sp.]MBO6761393.1 sigma-54-dependent Fis family transcriptional regulator [Roseivirga sp.]MBO6907674.1 sigma-54-dependent Fis family transcriptional regulator [Roseivirga sp.]WPZ10044.1 sigma-54 dependent transcriptional regulator [Roseivirga spongicola]
MKQKAKILILDDDNYVLLSLRILLEQHYTDVRGINSPTQLTTALAENEFDIVVLDMNFSAGDTSGKDGLKYLQQVKDANPNTSILLLTAYGEINLAVEAMRLGAYDFLVKPWENEKLLATIKTAFELNSAAKKIEHLETEKSVLLQELNAPFNEIIGESEAIKKVFSQIEKVAKTQANVLITGENGTGKELVARAIHKASDRANDIFLNVDMGAISETLFESELFGHKKGAFTDAKADRTGKFEAANNGTLFLDEIGNLPLPLQAKLLRVIQDQKVTKVGDNKEIDLNIRLICATNANLPELVKTEAFRQDLLFRINTIEIHLPPLRERQEDIPVLAQHFLNIYKQKYKKPGLFVADYVYNKLQKYDWPGNIRELQHAIERAVIMSDGKQLQVSDFNLKDTNETEIEAVDSFNLDQIEKWAIESAIKKHQGNISHAAQELGLSRGALYRRMEKYDL